MSCAHIHSVRVNWRRAAATMAMATRSTRSYDRKGGLQIDGEGSFRNGDRDGSGGGGGTMTQPLIRTSPPVAVKERKQVVFGRVEGENRGSDVDKLMSPVRVIEDDYFWMRDDKRKDERVIKYLEEENAYTASMMSSLKKEEDDLYAEMLGHVKEDDSSAPYQFGDSYEYYSRTEKNKSYRIHCRKPIGVEDREEIILDINKIAEGHKFCDVERIAVSPSHKLLAYSVDFVGYGA